MTGRIIQKMIEHFGKDVRRINHALKVYGFASCIARRENLSDNEILIIDIAAILHDIGIKNAKEKYNNTSGPYQEKEGPAVATDLLSEINLKKENLDRICYLIGNHHSYQKIDGIDFQILIEADFLVNIDEDKMPDHSIESIQKKYFKTQTGISLINSMYCKG
ncbi:HD domain-containing protein [Ancylomarina sp. 16SWW S1-10-2]|uniref:HD domain-containing protein n=1 Tax=Ancylomarina sp. 16SWW S1-10-2 TaxID=2499681 RepID=UPI0012AD49C7|nr:HD domain-containing protein [Ancylomarina sp. 16SWW S1-10-2]MRT92274.1 HD domain-containing protein [Ancylomarina sp. 16SWW S1-10-2]